MGIRRRTDILFRTPVALLVLAIVAAGIWFRIEGSFTTPLWLDEAYSAYAADKGFAFLWHVVPRYETHPPFYYSVLRIWTLIFGDSLGALRSLGIFCGIATPGVLLLAARELGLLVTPRLSRNTLVFVVLALAAFCFPLIQMTHEVRPYAPLILVYAGAMTALFRLARIAAAERRVALGPFVAYLLYLLLILWLHNLGVLYAGAIGLAFLVLVARPGLARRDWAWILGGHAIVALLWLPALLILLDQAPTWEKTTWLKFSARRLPDALSLIYGALDPIAMWCAALLALLALITLARGAEVRRAAGALLLLAIVPPAASLVITLLVAPVFIPRTMTAVAAPTIMLLAVAAARPTGLLRWPALAAALLLAGQNLSADLRAQGRPPMQDWYPALAWLEARWRPGDQVWAYPNEGALPFAYAVRDKGLKIATRPIPTPVPTLDGGPGAWFPTGSRGVVSLPPARLRALVRAPEAQAVPTIWLLRLGANAYDVHDELLNELRAVRVEIATCETYPIDLIGLRRRDLAGDVPALPVKRPRCRPGE